MTEPLTKGARTRQALLDNAIRRFAADGFRATSVSDIARDAGVTPAAAYAYFEGKDGLFAAAVDADAAGLIEKGLDTVLSGVFDGGWAALLRTLVDSLEEHPLARRMLSGLEPEHTERLLDIPALAELRRAVADNIRTGQSVGMVRRDIDPVRVASGLVTIILALLIGSLQTGIKPEGEPAAGVIAVLEAALLPPA